MSNQTAMLVLGMVELKHEETGATIALDVRGFDILGFLFPFLRLLFGAQWLLLFGFLCTFWVYPIWMWFVGFKYKEFRFKKYLKNGWSIVEK